jgi:toxin FitB
VPTPASGCTDRLAVVEATFDPLPVTVEVARAWGRLAAAVAQRGGKPRRRQLDLATAATATVEKVPLLTLNIADFRIIADLVDARVPS